MRGFLTYRGLFLFVVAFVVLGVFMAANMKTVPVYLLGEGWFSQPYGLYSEVPVFWVAFGGIGIGIFLTMVFQLPQISQFLRENEDLRARLVAARRKLRQQGAGGKPAKAKKARPEPGQERKELPKPKEEPAQARKSGEKAEVEAEGKPPEPAAVGSDDDEEGI